MLSNDPRSESSNKYRLQLLGLPVINNLEEFSQCTRISKQFIYNCSKNSSVYYKVYEITKKNGGVRKISQPNKKLKAIQSWILRNILDKLQSSSSSKGFEKDTTIRDNAIPHKGANVILTIDIRDFFENIKFEKVYRLFRSIGYNKSISFILTSLCTFEKSLPQGGPCSPKLSNLVNWKLDSRLNGFVGKKGITYTRYADDLSFSSLIPNKLTSSLSFIEKIVNNEGYLLNHKKTRIAGPSKAKKVTGLIVSNKSVGIGRKQLKIIRAKLNNLSLISDTEINFKEVQQILGLLAFVKSVDKEKYDILNKYITQKKLKHPTSLITQIKLSTK